MLIIVILYPPIPHVSPLLTSYNPYTDTRYILGSVQTKDELGGSLDFTSVDTNLVASFVSAPTNNNNCCHDFLVCFVAVCTIVIKLVASGRIC